MRGSSLARREQVVFVTEVLSAVRLSEAGNTRGIESSGLGGAACCNTKSKRRVVHAVHDYTLVLRAVLRPASNVRLDNVAAVKEGHSTVLLDPDLVSGVLSNDGQRSDVKAKLARPGELAYK